MVENAEFRAVLIPAWTVGDRLRKARMVLGLEREDLSLKDASGKLSVWQIANYERDVVVPKETILDKLAELLEISATWLLTGETPTDPQGPNGGISQGNSGIAGRVAKSKPPNIFNFDTLGPKKGFSGGRGIEPIREEGEPLRRAA